MAMHSSRWTGGWKRKMRALEQAVRSHSSFVLWYHSCGRPGRNGEQLWSHYPLSTYTLWQPSHSPGCSGWGVGVWGVCVRYQVIADAEGKVGVRHEVRTARKPFHNDLADRRPPARASWKPTRRGSWISARCSLSSPLMHSGKLGLGKRDLAKAMKNKKCQKQALWWPCQHICLVSVAFEWTTSTVLSSWSRPHWIGFCRIIKTFY